MNPRLLTQAQAANYCSYSTSRFSELVRKGVLPQPIHATHRWDKKKLDRTLDQMSGLETNEPLSPYDDWKASEDGQSGA